jgi:predicted amino acid-binding ACT domain protein
MPKHDKKRYVISVLVSDRVGILRDISAAVTDLGANIDGISQTVVAGYFTVILTASFDQPHPPSRIRDAIEERFGTDEATVVVRPYDRRDAKRQTVDGESYVVTLTGRDRPGILKAVTRFLAAKGINIEDWHVEFRDADVLHIGEVTVPAALDIQQAQEEFRQVVAALGLVVVLQHENIFRATNEIGPIKSLIGRPA